ncbi:MAG TPA: hypothetical protein VLZ83_06680 [Edaphocola sp.]|nr:hypothetical protein [Edaphocola sp.]
MPWVIVGIVIVLLLIYFLIIRDNKNESELINPTSENSHRSVNENISTVAAYVSFVENNKEKMGLDHSYTNEALLKLIDATNAIAAEVGFEVGADLENVREYANRIKEDQLETKHADNIRKADDILTTVLQNIQKTKFPKLANEVAELKVASESIRPDVLALDQKDAIKNYFAKAAALLQKMN